MVIAKFKKLTSGFLYSLFIAFSVFANTACAIDNPEAADFISEFQSREQAHITATDNPDNSTREYLLAYDNYLQFLDKELNAAYQQVKSKLSEEEQELLTQSQRNWIKYRDAEFELIKKTWTRQNYGSSAGISRGDYKSKIVKQRILQLLAYMKSF